jgi:hypothetical protein
VELGFSPKKFAKSPEKREIPAMNTVTVDDDKRVRIPDTEPGQVFDCTPNPDGSYVLVPVTAERTEMFPPGSLLKYFSGDMGRERDQRDASLLSACLQAPE